MAWNLRETVVIVKINFFIPPPTSFNIQGKKVNTSWTNKVRYFTSFSFFPFCHFKLLLKYFYVIIVLGILATYCRLYCMLIIIIIGSLLNIHHAVAYSSLRLFLRVQILLRNGISICSNFPSKWRGKFSSGEGCKLHCGCCLVVLCVNIACCSYLQYMVAIETKVARSHSH